MASRYPNIWKWLPLLALGLILLGWFAPISDSLDKILTVVGLLLLLVFFGVTRREERRERHADQSSDAEASSDDQT